MSSKISKKCVLVKPEFFWVNIAKSEVNLRYRNYLKLFLGF